MLPCNLLSRRHAWTSVNPPGLPCPKASRHVKRGWLGGLALGSCIYLHIRPLSRPMVYQPSILGRRFTHSAVGLSILFMSLFNTVTHYESSCSSYRPCGSGPGPAPVSFVNEEQSSGLRGGNPHGNSVRHPPIRSSRNSARLPQATHQRVCFHGRRCPAKPITF